MNKENSWQIAHCPDCKAQVPGFHGPTHEYLGTSAGCWKVYGEMRRLTAKQVCEMARAFDGVTEKDHFGSDAFCANGRIFATVWHDKNEVNLMLNVDQQKSFLAIDGEGFNQIDNAWGRNGATNVQLEFVDREQFTEALKAAWINSANKRTVNRKASKKTKAVSVKNQKSSRRPS